MLGKIRTAVNNEPDDYFLVERAKLGDKEAFSMLYERYARLVYNMAYCVLQDRTDAEDLAHDIFVELATGRIKIYDPSRREWAKWLADISFNRARNRKAYLSRHRKYYCSEAEDILNFVAAPGDFGAVVEAGRDAERVRAAFSQLNDNQKRTLELVFFREMTITEASEMLPDSVENTRHHYYRGLKKLKDLLMSAFESKVFGVFFLDISMREIPCA